MRRNLDWSEAPFPTSAGLECKLCNPSNRKYGRDHRGSRLHFPKFISPKNVYNTVLCTGRRAGQNLSRESVGLGFLNNRIVNKRAFREEITDSTKQCDRKTFTVLV